MKDLISSEEDEDSQFSELDVKRKTSKFNQLIHERVAKIVKMADSRVVAPPRKSNLTLSEQLLLKKLFEFVRAWKAEFIKKDD